MTKIQGVYLIQNTELPFKYKIGKSDDIHRRLKDLRMSSGCELCLIDAIKTELPTLVEKKLQSISIVTGKQIGRASCRERVSSPV